MCSGIPLLLVCSSSSVCLDNPNVSNHWGWAPLFQVSGNHPSSEAQPRSLPGVYIPSSRKCPKPVNPCFSILHIGSLTGIWPGFAEAPSVLPQSGRCLKIPLRPRLCYGPTAPRNLPWLLPVSDPRRSLSHLGFLGICFLGRPRPDRSKIYITHWICSVMFWRELFLVLNSKGRGPRGDIQECARSHSQALTSVRHLYCSGVCLRKVPEQSIRKVLRGSRVLT